VCSSCSLTSSWNYANTWRVLFFGSEFMFLSIVWMINVIIVTDFPHILRWIGISLSFFCVPNRCHSSVKSMLQLVTRSARINKLINWMGWRCFKVAITVIVTAISMKYLNGRLIVSRWRLQWESFGVLINYDILLIWWLQRTSLGYLLDLSVHIKCR
jgi:hypothetical protein